MTADGKLASLTLSVLTTLAVILTVATVGSGAAAAANTGTISDCTTIAASGVYELDGDVDGSAASTCIVISSSDVVLDGGGHSITGSDAFDSVGVHVDGSSGARLTNVTVRNLTVTDWETGLRYDASDDGAVVNVAATSNTEYGLHFEGATNVAAVEVTTADHSDWGDAGIRIFGGSDHTIRDSSFSDEYTGVDIIAAQGIAVRDSAFADTAPSVAIADSGGVVVDNNVIVDGSLGVLSGSSGPANRVTNNTVYESSQYATGADCGGMTIDGAEDDLVAHNTWTQCNWGVHIDDSERIEFRNNSITGTDGGNSDYGLWVDGGADNKILDNTIENNGRYPKRAGILLGTHRTTLSGNTLAGNGFNLEIGTGGNWNNISHTIDATNTVEGRPVAYHVNETDVTVDPSAGWVGLVGTRNVTVADVDFAANNRRDVMIRYADDTVIRNVDASPSWVAVSTRDGSDRTRIEDSHFDGGRGVSLREGTEAYVVNTSVTNSGGYGIYLSEAPETTFENVTVTGNSRKGIGVRNGESGTVRVTVANSTVSDNDWGGVDFYRADHSEVRDSVIGNNSGAGIQAQRYVDNVTITGNHVTGNDGDGVTFSLYPQDNRIADNVITDNAGNGVELGNQGHGDTITRNDVTGNAAGISVQSTYDDLTVFDNRFNNTQNVAFSDPAGLTNATWNTTAASGTNVVGGDTVGGNYWATPAGTGFSETCTDRGDGICDSSFAIAGSHVDYLPLASTTAPAGEPDITVSPASLAFGDVTVGQTVTVDLDVTNEGTAPLDVSGRFLSGPNGSEFTVGGGTTVLAPGETHTFYAGYAPSSTGPHSGTLRITSNDSDASSLHVPLSGTGLDATVDESEIHVSPTTIEFGGVNLTETERELVTVENVGSGALDVSATTLGGANPSSFSFGTAATLGPDGSFVVPSGDSVTFLARYTPTADRNHSATMTFASNDSDESTVVVTLDGYGVAAVTPAPPSGNDGSSSNSGNSGNTGSSGSSGSNSGSTVQTPPATSVDVDRSATGVTNVSVENARNGTAVSVNTSGQSTGNISLDGIDVTPLVDGDFTLNVTARESAPAGAPTNAPNWQTPIAYLDVDHSIADDDIGEVTFRFRVSKATLADRGLAPEDVVVYRYHNGQWGAASMNVSGETTDEYVFEATVPGLSVFAVGSAAQGATETATPTATATPSSTATATPTATLDGAAPPAESTDRSQFPTAILAGGLLVLILGGALVALRR